MFLCLAAVILANQLFQVPHAYSTRLLDYLTSSLLNKSAFFYLAWFAVFHLLAESKPGARASATDVSVALLLACVNFLAATSVASLSATVAGLFMLATSAEDRKLRAAAVVVLALSLNGLWGPLLFEVLAVPILRADAALVGTLLSWTQPGMTWEDTVIGTPSGHRVLVYSPCSSFHNISLGLLCWVSVTKLLRTRWVRADYLVAIAVVATVVALNASRLYLMALSPEHFAYWHDGGFGAQLFLWVTTIAVFAISLVGAVRAGRKEA